MFSGFRVLGLYSNHVPHAVRFHQKHREFYLVAAVGRSFHTYNVSTWVMLVTSTTSTPQVGTSVFYRFRCDSTVTSRSSSEV